MNLAITISILVRDRLIQQTGSGFATFSVTPSGGLMECQPLTALAGFDDVWSISELASGNTITGSVDPLTGIMTFNYTQGIFYTIKLTRTSNKKCAIYSNVETINDNPESEKRSFRNSSNDEQVSDTDIASTTTLEAYPNPTNGLVNIRLNNPTLELGSIRVLNTLGQVVFELEHTNSTRIELDLSKETSGVYWIQVTNGDDKFIEKVIKQ